MFLLYPKNILSEKNPRTLQSELGNARKQELHMRVGVNEWRRIERMQTTQNTDQDKMDIKQRDGGRQKRGVWCYANESLVLLLRCGQHWHKKR